MDKLFDLKDKIVVITGGMGQLGQVYSKAFAERGAKVCIWDLDISENKLKDDIAEYVKKDKIKIHKVDITDHDSVDAGFSKVCEGWGVPDVLVNNAALDSPPDAPPEEVGPFETYPETSFDKVMQVNVKGTLLCCQVIGGTMAKAEKGSIINISSIYGILSPCQDIYEFRRVNGEEFYKPVAYSVSKSAIMNLTRYLSTYWAKKGIRVNTVSPAGIFNNQPEEFLKAYCARVPMGRMAREDELVGAVIFLASDASSYITGSNIIIDGGMSAW